ncbi:uncharacterized protein LOC130592117 [Beta vulgaris subsp. vulgaris]|uniref:uncharacterized protein LOC130592117 n=1 Tax=Beta vulgaris subsp. vulgaris TaxID=3555 RepID=UPI002548036F|nr:uncharacterized protein LOC130592117 [Beta vulgaris subsp. vulgaris]
MAESATNSVQNELNNANSGRNELNNVANGGNNLDPLFVSNSDNPTSSLVSVTFSGTNFIRWSQNVRRALIAKNKDGFITGLTSKPNESSPDYLKWTRADYMVMSWILSSMNPQIADDFAYVSNSVELWQELNERFGQSNGPLIYQLKKEIDSLRQENLTIIAYYGKIKRLWDELKSLRMTPSCCCGALNKCTCQFVKRLADIEAEDKLMQFLLGLNSGFESTITNILSMEPLPTINRAFSITQQIEKQKEISGVLEIGESSAMAVHKYNQGMSAAIQRFQGKKDWKKEKLEKKCDHCKGKGHTMDQCFKIIGYPEWYTAVKGAKGGNGGSTGGNRKFAPMFMLIIMDIMILHWIMKIIQIVMITNR